LAGTCQGRVVAERNHPTHVRKDAVFQTRSESFKFTSRVNLSDPSVKALYSAAFFPELIAFYEREYKEGIRPQLTTAFAGRQDRLCRRLRRVFFARIHCCSRSAPAGAFAVSGLLQRLPPVFPTIEAAAEGGYGADSTVSPVESAPANGIMDRALIHLWEMRASSRNRQHGEVAPDQVIRYNQKRHTKYSLFRGTYESFQQGRFRRGCLCAGGVFAFMIGCSKAHDPWGEGTSLKVLVSFPPSIASPRACRDDARVISLLAPNGPHDIRRM